MTSVSTDFLPDYLIRHVERSEADDSHFWYYQQAVSASDLHKRRQSLLKELQHEIKSVSKSFEVENQDR